MNRTRVIRKHLVNLLLPVVLLATGVQWPAAEANPAVDGTSSPEPATPAFTDPTDLLDRVRIHLEAEVAELPAQDSLRYEIELGRLDPRLRLPACADEPVAETSSGGIGRVAVKVSCNAGVHWNIYVTGHIRAYREVLVAAHPLPRNSLISRSDVVIAEMDVGNLSHSYYTQPEEVLGLLVKRPVRANQVINAAALRLPRLVRRGDMVLVIAENGAVRVQIEGVAMADGALGDMIRVKNPRSGRIIRAEVRDKGEVRVVLPDSGAAKS